MDNNIKDDGILSKGYGVVPKLVMKDRKLTIEAKAIYSYMCSFAGAGETAFPGVDLICVDLGIKRERFYKHKKLLEQYGYITIQKERANGRFTRNIYTLNKIVLPCTEKPCTEKPCTEKPCTEKPCTENRYTNNNSINNNSINNNSINNNSSSIIATTTNSELEDICNMYKREITNRIDCSPYEIQTFEDLLKEHNADEITLAIEIAVKRNKRSLGYIEGILKNKNKEGAKVAKYNRDTKQEIDWSKFD